MANQIALQLLADANPLIKGMQQAQSAVNRFVDASNEAGQSIGGGLNRAIDTFMNFSKGGAAAAGILAGGFVAAAAGAVALTASAGRQIEALDMLAQKTGISLKTLQGWSVIMAENDFQAESLTSAMRTLSTKMVEAKDPASKAAAAFKEMGIQAKDLGSTESVIRALADRFATMPDGPEKAAMAFEVLGRSGLDLIPILNRGSKALDESKEAAERFGVAMHEVSERNLKNADDAMDRVGVAADALKMHLGAMFAPSVEMAAQGLAETLGVLAGLAREVDTAMDTLAIRLTHIALAAKELGGVVFSKGIFDSGAWTQALDNITLIDKEASKLIAKRRELAPLSPDSAPGAQVNMAATAAAGATKNIPQIPPFAEQQNQHLVEYLANRRAEEALGHVLVQIAQREHRELSKKVQVQDQIEQEMAAISEQEQIGHQIVLQSSQAWRHRNDALDMAVDRLKVLDEAQETMFRTEGALGGAADAARQARLALIDAQAARERQAIEETIFNEQKKAAAIMNLETQVDTKRRQTIQAFPTFFEQQMQAIVASNAFSIAQITTTWTSGLANAAVRGGDFVKQAWESTQIAVLQGLLNFGIQAAAQWALQASVEVGLLTATNATKLGLTNATNAALIAGEQATATARLAIQEGTDSSILSSVMAVGGALKGFFLETVMPALVAVGEAIMGFFSSIAAASEATIFGIPLGIAIMAGVAVMAAAIGALAAFAFADGGIVTKPTMGMIGEAGSSEAVIPLNSRGASFVRDALGGTGGGEQIVYVQIGDDVIMKKVARRLPSAIRLRGVPIR